jgi:hypothetical protein
MNQASLLDLLNERDDDEIQEPLTYLHDSPYLDDKALINLGKLNHNKFFILA